MTVGDDTHSAIQGRFVVFLGDSTKITKISGSGSGAVTGATRACSSWSEQLCLIPVLFIIVESWWFASWAF